MITTKKRSNFRRCGSTAVRGIAAAILTAGMMITMPFTAAAEPAAGPETESGPVHEAGYRLKITKQGYDKAVFDKNTEKFDVCDKEKDGHGVYVYFSYNSDKLYYDDTSGCTRYKQPKDWHNLGIMYVCEDVWGPDWCSDGIVLITQ